MGSIRCPIATTPPPSTPPAGSRSAPRRLEDSVDRRTSAGFASPVRATSPSLPQICFRADARTGRNLHSSCPSQRCDGCDWNWDGSIDEPGSSGTLATQVQPLMSESVFVAVGLSLAAPGVAGLLRPGRRRDPLRRLHSGSSSRGAGLARSQQYLRYRLIAARRDTSHRASHCCVALRFRSFVPGG